MGKKEEKYYLSDLVGNLYARHKGKKAAELKRQAEEVKAQIELEKAEAELKRLREKNKG